MTLRFPWERDTLARQSARIRTPARTPESAGATSVASPPGLGCEYPLAAASIGGGDVSFPLGTGHICHSYPKRFPRASPASGTTRTSSNTLSRNNLQKASREGVFRERLRGSQSDASSRDTRTRHDGFWRKLGPDPVEINRTQFKTVLLKKG